MVEICQVSKTNLQKLILHASCIDIPPRFAKDSQRYNKNNDFADDCYGHHGHLHNLE